VPSSATSSSERRQPKPGIPSAEGAAGVAGLPCRINRTMEVGSAASTDELPASAQRIEAEPDTGLFIDYTAGHRVIFADLIERYIDEGCPSLKSSEVDTVSLESFLIDLGRAHAERKRARDLKAGRTRRNMPPRHDPRNGIERLLKPVAKVVALDLHRYIAERLEQGLAPPALLQRGQPALKRR
jgi:hypothetical protein